VFEGRTVEIRKVMQGKEHVNSEPFGKALYGDRDRVTTVGPDDIGPVLAEEDVAGRKEGLCFLDVQPTAACRGVFKNGDRQIAVDGE
jgi:hypothetical protein